MKTLNFDFVKIHPKSKIPGKTIGDLGFDLSVVRDKEFYEYSYLGSSTTYKYILKPGERKLFDTGLQISAQTGYGFILKDRSGMAAKYGIHVLAGVIDSSYTGPIKVCLLNTSDKDYCITEGDRIVQAIVIPEYSIIFNEKKELNKTSRGEKGFGSSGK